jgi:tRNA pseudouridine13 synthase
VKVKQQPEDFQVEEQTDVTPASEGRFALYRLTKRGWTTHDALGVIRRRWNLDRQRVSFGGLKDRHALTSQYFTVLRGPCRKLMQQGIAVEYLGQVARPFTAEAIRANAFHITLRALTAQQIERATAALEKVRHDGLPNYFDDQRFGSVGTGGEFVAREIILGRYEEALRLALSAPYEHDRSAAKKEKAILREHWGDWVKCKELLPRSHARSLVDFLLYHPGDFRGALDRLSPDLRGLYLSAFQSHLWNLTLARWIEGRFPPERLIHVPMRFGPEPVPNGLDKQSRQDLELQQIPLPSPRVVFPADGKDDVLAEMQEVFAQHGIEPDQLKLRGFKKMFFSRGERAAWCSPAELNYNSAGDALHSSRSQLQLSFELPRGCYATLLIKRITAAGKGVKPLKIKGSHSFSSSPERNQQHER